MKKIVLFSIYFSLSIFFAACGVTNFIAKGFENFTTYFNIYYNASKLFNEAEKEILKQQKDIFTDKPYQVSGNLTSKFVTVIEKCSKILQYHSKSSFIDNVLFIIGKSYFYQKEYPSAIRKFTELVSNFPESPYYLESKLWIARSYANTIETDRSLRLLNEVYQEAEDEEEIRSQALMEILKIYYKRNDYEGFVNLGKEFISISDDDEAIAQVLLQIGISYYKLGKLDEAKKSFELVNDYTNDYYYQFKSQLELAKIFRELGNFENAEIILNDLYSESLFEEYKDYTELEYAYLNLARNDTVTAFKFFTKVDTTYSSKETGGIAQFEIASYLENTLKNLDSAKYYYEKSLRTPITEQYKKIAQKKVSIFTRYKTLWTSINNLQKQIPFLRTFPVDSTYQKFQEIEIDSSMLSDSAYLADLQDYLEQKRVADSLYFVKLQRDSATYRANLKTADSLEVNIARLKFELATLFMIDFNQPDSAGFYLQEIVNKFPDKDFSERAYYALANYFIVKGENQKVDSLYRLIYDNFPDSEITRAVARRLNLKPKVSEKNIPELEYQEAEQLALNGKYKDAIKKLYDIVQNHSKTDFAPKALLMIGYIYEEKLKQNDSAYSVYKELKSKYPGSLYTQRINSKLIAYESELQRKEQEKIQEQELKKENENPDSLKPYENGEIKNEELTEPEIQQQNIPQKQDSSITKELIEEKLLREKRK